MIKLDFANREIDRLELLLEKWQKYGNDWKREAQLVQNRVSELELRELELSEQIKAAEGCTAPPDTEKKEIERLTSALADQTVCSPYLTTHVHVVILTPLLTRQRWNSNGTLVKSLRNASTILKPRSHSSVLNYHPSNLHPLILHTVPVTVKLR
jgi:hypothetical protein